MRTFCICQAQESGEEAARQALIQERQKELVSGLQQEHHVQAAAMERQVKAAAQQVIYSCLAGLHRAVLWLVGQ